MYQILIVTPENYVGILTPFVKNPSLAIPDGDDVTNVTEVRTFLKTLKAE